MPDQAQSQSANANNQSNVEKHKIKVNGVEKEVDTKELIELAQKGEDYTNKTKALAEKERLLKEEEVKVAGVKAIVDEMQQNPQLAETLNKVYSDFKSGNTSKSDKDRSMKKLDALLDKAATSDEREQLRDIRRIISEETDSDSLKNEIKSLKDELNSLKDLTHMNQDEIIDKNVSSLESRFGKELVAKYDKAIRDYQFKYPKANIEKIFYHVASNEDIRQALLTEEKGKKAKEEEAKSRGSMPSGRSQHSPTAPPRDKHGKVIWKDWVKNLQSSGRL